MKIIDLLNKMANNEDVPKRIKVFGEEFNYDDYDYYSIHSSSPLMSYVGEDYLKTEMNYEVEILEEEKKIPEKLEDYSLDEKGKYPIEPTLYEEILKNKINEIIDYLNNKGDE